MKKRIAITVEAEPYDKLQKNAKRAGFGAKWFGREIDKLVQGLNKIVTKVVEIKEQGFELTEEERNKKILEMAEETFGVKLKDLLK